MIPEFPKKMPSFISIDQKKKDAISNSKINMRHHTNTSNNAINNNGSNGNKQQMTNLRKGSKGSPISRSYASRHEKCFESYEPINNKIIRRRRLQKEFCRNLDKGVCQTQSTSSIFVKSSSNQNHRDQSRPTSTPTPTISQPSLPQTLYSDDIEIKEVTTQTKYMWSLSPTQHMGKAIGKVLGKGQRYGNGQRINRSPVAFGRSISKERSYAEEKKRLENVLPLEKHTFEATTNILRDPALNSPQDVKKAIRSIAQYAIKETKQQKQQQQQQQQPSQHFSKRLCLTCRNRNRPHINHQTLKVPTTKMVKHYRPDYEHIEVVRGFKKTSPQTRSTTATKSSTATRNDKVCCAKRNFTQSLVKTKSSSLNTVKSLADRSTGQRNHKTKSTTCAKTQPLKDGKQQYKYVRGSHGEPIIQEMHDIEIFNPINHKVSVDSEESIMTPLTKPEQTTKWLNEQSKSLPQPIVPSVVYEEESLNRKSHCSSPSATILTSEYVTQSEVTTTNLTPRTETEETDELRSSLSSRKFSPTREVRVPPQLSSSSTLHRHEVRSPSHRKIDSYRHHSQRDGTMPSVLHHKHKIIRASSLSSADERARNRSKRGLYLCREMCHSASHLPNEPQSPTCPYYKHNSERFLQLNKFYHTLERIGQLEKFTSSLDFKPLHKSHDHLDYNEWCKVRSHEKLAKELRHLVNRLWQEQHEHDLLYRSKDPAEIKWSKDHDLGLCFKEKSVEDLRENFEKIHLFHDYQQYTTTNPDTNFTKLKLKSNEAEQPRNIQREATSPISEELIITIDSIKRPFVSPLKVRCHSNLTPEQLLCYTNKTKALLVQSKGHDKLIHDLKPPPKVPPRPNQAATAATRTTQGIATTTTSTSPIIPKFTKESSDSGTINQKIKYFEERKYAEPPKIVYRAREDSSTDEEEIRRLIEMRQREKLKESNWKLKHHHKELSTSLNSLIQLYGERPMQKVHLRIPTIPPKPPDIYDYYDYHAKEQKSSMESNRGKGQSHGQGKGKDKDKETPQIFEFDQSDIAIDNSSLPMATPSHSSSYLGRVHTGEVKKIKQKFEHLYQQGEKQQQQHQQKQQQEQQQQQQQQHEYDRHHFFELRKLRKVRSDSELLATVSESKDALTEQSNDVSWLTYKYEQQQQQQQQCLDKVTSKIKATTIPTSSTIKSDTIFEQINQAKRKNNHLNYKYKNAKMNPIKDQRTTVIQKTGKLSTNIKNALATFWSKKYDTCQKQQRHHRLQRPQRSQRMQRLCHLISHENILNDSINRPHGKIKMTTNVSATNDTNSMAEINAGCTSKLATTNKTRDIFANQLFDPKIHQPKARYIPEGVTASTTTNQATKSKLKVTTFSTAPTTETTKTTTTATSKQMSMPRKRKGQFVTFKGSYNYI